MIFDNMSNELSKIIRISLSLIIRYAIIFRDEMRDNLTSMHAQSPISALWLFITVNSEIFVKVLFSRNFIYAKFREV